MEPGEDRQITIPMAVFVGGRASDEADRLCDAILDLRPGVFFVFGAH
jgi:hypothetical protein